MAYEVRNGGYEENPYIITTDTSKGYSEVTRHVFAKVGVK